MIKGNIRIIDRKDCLENGIRDSLEINKTNFKRPYKLMRPWEKGALVDLMKWSYYRPYYFANYSVSKDSDAINLAKRLLLKKRVMTLEEVKKHDNLKDKTIVVYVEKYSDNVYTVRDDIRFNTREIAELYCEDVYLIAGEFVIINFDKRNGKYYFKHVLPAYEYDYKKVVEEENKKKGIFEKIRLGYKKRKYFK